jgi:hypothetical protein
MTMRRVVRGLGLGLVLCGASVLTSGSAWGQEVEPPAPAAGWDLMSGSQVDLWYHALALIGFDQIEGLPLYNILYVQRVQEAREAAGVSTQLDQLSATFLEAFQNEAVFQNFHFLPLYFPLASPERMLDGLAAVADRSVSDRDVVGPDTRNGIRTAAAMFRSGDQREVLGQFVAALRQEWDVFFGDYWREQVALDSGLLAAMQVHWDEVIGPAANGFLEEERMFTGRIFVSAPLGPDGRMLKGNAFQGLENAVAVWLPDRADTTASVYSAVREICFSAVDGSAAAVRCGSMVLQETSPALAAEYQRIWVSVAGGDTSAVTLGDTFEKAYPAQVSEVEAIEQIVAANPVAAGDDEVPEQPLSAWVVQPKAQVDLWFHSMAVIQADQPGPLALYSADYAREIREVKMERGVYPTMLDQLADDLRDRIGDDPAFDQFHFLPLYFPRADPERMLDVLLAVAERRTNDPSMYGPDVGNMVFNLSRLMDGGRERGLLRDLVEAITEEWNLFYRDYWEEEDEARTDRYAAVQSMWDSLFAPKLAGYLERRRLTGGLLVPSAAIGPEGRIVESDSYNPRDQVVSVQMPLSTERPEATVYAFLKELCFLLVDDQRLARYMTGPGDFEDLRRRVAVRCGAYIMEFYAPIMAAGYRRVFLDAVGAEESSTVSAFERVYALDPEVAEFVREQIRRR